MVFTFVWMAETPAEVAAKANLPPRDNRLIFTFLQGYLVGI